MTYDRELADGVRAAFATQPGLSEKAMFGGLAFLVDGAMAVAVAGQDGLMVRCDPALAGELVAAHGVDRMVMRGRELDGWLLVRPDVLDDEALRRWVGIGRAGAAAAGVSSPAGSAPGTARAPRRGAPRTPPTRRASSTG
ncbi:TfoX/Sxy family protein [uncultured Modestobacter sp.]|uniref:TfoX/Sxy family protein n=1 Tax=uncultured Modestobacter sp. TaxID=380048 RepID=UPI002610FCC6|nr:TfoX/Sxy family protein [uncultured Modestobacter sp.]